MRKYLACALIGLQTSLAYPSALVGSALAMTLFMYVFYEFWTVTYQMQPGLAGLTSREMLWYLLAAETVILSHVGVAQDIAASVRDGSISFELTRPISHAGSRFARSFGEILPYLVVNFVAGAAFVICTVGLLDSFVGLGYFAMASLLGVVLHFLISYLIGLSALVFEDVSALEWIYGKLLLVAGGGLIPLDLFSGALREVLTASPFALIVYRPARFLIGRDLSSFENFLTLELIWMVILWIAAFGTFRILSRKVMVNGG